MHIVFNFNNLQSEIEERFLNKFDGREDGGKEG
jgi:hypothetical protein